MKKIAIILVIFLFGCVSQQNTVTYDFKEIIGLYENNKMLFINVTLNGRPAKLLIDTGASKSLLDINFAEEYGYKCYPLAIDKYIGLGGLHDVYAIANYDIDEFFTPFLGTDLGEITGYFKDAGVEIVGVLGADFLEMHRAVIDFEKNLMYKKR